MILGLAWVQSKTTGIELLRLYLAHLKFAAFQGRYFIQGVACHWEIDDVRRMTLQYLPRASAGPSQKIPTAFERVGLWMTRGLSRDKFLPLRAIVTVRAFEQGLAYNAVTVEWSDALFQATACAV